MSRSRDAHDPFSDFDAAAAAYETATPHVQAADPFGPAGEAYAQHAPVFASPSLVPSADLRAASFEDDDVEYPAARKKPVALYAGVGVALLAGALFIGNHFVAQGRAEEQRLAEIAKVQQTMAELEAKRRADEASRVQQPAPAAGATSSVAALLAASTQSYGAAQSPQAAKPNGLAAARQAAAIQRALQAPGVARRGKAMSAGKASGPRRAAREEDDGLRENHSNDPIYGL